MDNTSDTYIGVDVGGTHLKIGLVDNAGEILFFNKEDTKSLREDPKGFNRSFVENMENYLSKFPEVRKIGIGLPGLISKDRTTPLEIPAIPDLNGFNLKQALEKAYPGKKFYLENDACVAALGELRFGSSSPSEDFLFITLGTGIGSALVDDGKIFKGARGNGLEMGHVLSRGNARLETLIGRNGILNIMERMIKAFPEKAGVLVGRELGTHLLVDTAMEGNPVSLMVFEEVGDILGEALVTAIRILDVNEIYFGGGISAGLQFMLPSLEKTIRQYLTDYYLNGLKLKKASLENNAGTLGAAALCFMDKT